MVNDDDAAPPAVHRSGFVAFVGRPNAGKSTLTNALVGSKIVITSDKPQTTRRAVRGLLSRPDGQLVLVDTPGLHRPRTLLGERLNDVVRNTLADVDVIGFCVPADQKIGPGDRYIAEELKQLRAPVVAIVTKTDATSRQRVAEQLMAMSKLGEFADVVPVSAVSGDQVGLLADLIIAKLPEGPALYPEDIATDESDEARIAELIREAALADVRDELPHSIAVTVEEMNERVDTGDDPTDEPARNTTESTGKHTGRAAGKPALLDIFATIHLERSSQKPIILGRGGQRLRDIGTVARGDIEALLGRRVFLNLHVAVLAEWQRDPKKLDRLGF
ncbi:GTPase Era [Jatrophihabitans telluris]|uniref:GTPase Era n=1 Tax=Jatrophihabitans telluris TaxID=2038343 RepID=A0ABY4QX22_9ACTN|nr:GTPase Era [Jatrophihabitans telluris]UQX87489.1 GTPase Era [Jatrophihabitans telluris]